MVIPFLYLSFCFKSTTLFREIIYKISKHLLLGVVIMKAFVLVSLDGAGVRRFMNELQTLPQVKEAYILFGEWDVIAQVEFPNAEQLAAFVMDKIRTKKDVKLTSSLIVGGE